MVPAAGQARAGLRVTGSRPPWRTPTGAGPWRSPVPATAAAALMPCWPSFDYLLF